MGAVSVGCWFGLGVCVGSVASPEGSELGGELGEGGNNWRLMGDGRRDALATVEEGAQVGQKTRLQLKVKILEYVLRFPISYTKVMIVYHESSCYIPSPSPSHPVPIQFQFHAPSRL